VAKSSPRFEAQAPVKVVSPMRVNLFASVAGTGAIPVQKQDEEDEDDEEEDDEEEEEESLRLLTPPPTPPGAYLSSPYKSPRRPGFSASASGSSTSSIENQTHTHQSVHSTPRKHLLPPQVPPSPATVQFNARKASARCRMIEGYVSFASVEGLGAPPDPEIERRGEGGDIDADKNGWSKVGLGMGFWRKLVKGDGVVV